MSDPKNQTGSKKLSGTFTEPAAAASSLSLATLDLLPPAFKTPAYDPKAVTPSILHIGPSNFARAHIAKMAHDVLNLAAKDNQPLDFGIIAASLKSPAAKHALGKQDNLYTLTSKGAGVKPTHEVIGSISKILCAQEDAASIIKKAADPSIKIITMTVTQNGYEPSKTSAESLKVLDTENPEFSTVRLVVHSLNYRRQNNLPVPVLLSLDNMNANGTKLLNKVTEEASLIDPLLAEWIKEYVPFPNTMVDRITPSKSDNHTCDITALGVNDAWPVLAEPMPQIPLVIEDMSNERGPIGQVFRDSGIDRLKDVGASFSPNVGYYESMKLRMLNGAHMALGCVGTLCGYKTSDEAMQDPQVRAFVGKFMDQVITTLDKIPGVDFNAYKEELINRLDNPHICDPLTRLARNGISKVNDRLLDTVRGTMANNKPNDCITFAVAAWLQYAGDLTPDGFNKDKNGVKILGNPDNPDEANDKDAKKSGFVDDINRNRATINSVFHTARSEIWGKDLVGNSRFIGAVQSQFERIENKGIRHALALLVGGGDKPSYDIGTPTPPRKDLH